LVLELIAAVSQVLDAVPQVGDDPLVGSLRVFPLPRKQFAGIVELIALGLQLSVGALQLGHPAFELLPL
jgi:hypothetical protein